MHNLSKILKTLNPSHELSIIDNDKHPYSRQIMKERKYVLGGGSGSGAGIEAERMWWMI